MGSTCSRFKSARYQEVILSRVEPCLASVTRKRGGNEERQRDDGESCKKNEQDDTVRRSVSNSVDANQSAEEAEDSGVPRIKEIKVLPPIRTRANTMATVTYTPNRVWGGSVSSFLETIKRDSCIDEDVITGGKRRGRRVSSLKQHNLGRGSNAGQLIDWEKQVKVLSEVDEPEGAIQRAALDKRRRSLINNAKLVSSNY